VGTLDGGDGYVLVEADDPKIITSFVAKFIHWNDIEVIPVIDIGDVVAISGANIGWARRASKS
jgi:Protein of unknown function (DUF3303)